MRRITTGVVLLLCMGLSASADEPAAKGPAGGGSVWKGLHMASPGHGGVPLLKRAIAEGVAPLGVNVLVLEVGYQFAFQSHPELADPGGLTRDDAHALAALCRAHKIRLVPQFNCLGHQSWASHTFSLLTKYPELDETPEAPRDNKGLYCRSWCPLHPKTNPIVFALIDELAEAFEADAFHVGMDEVFLIASPKCPRCQGKDPAVVFARTVNDLHQHVVGDKKLTMLMWGDRLIDGAKTGYGKWEGSENGTAAAIDQIPKDIIMCDWHYELRPSYPSVHTFQEKGFRVWPSSWKNQEAALAFLADARRGANDRMIGQLCTTWTSSEAVCRALLGEGDASKKSENNQAIAALRACMAQLKP
jgi:hypothetical protein